jgi:hypothetical protein
MVERSHVQEIGLVLVFHTVPPSIEELKRVRSLLPELSNATPVDLRQRIRDGRLELGVRPALEARAIISRAQSLGLRADSTTCLRTSYVFENRTTGAVLLVEDDAQAAQLANEMIAAGVPVREVEVD